MATATKNVKTRIISKHDTEANWQKATNFIPLKGEIIIYDADTVGNSLPRMKIGDGETRVNSLNFVDEIEESAQETLSAGGTITHSFGDLYTPSNFYLNVTPSGSDPYLWELPDGTLSLSTTNIPTFEALDASDVNGFEQINLPGSSFSTKLSSLNKCIMTYDLNLSSTNTAYISYKPRYQGVSTSYGVACLIGLSLKTGKVYVIPTGGRSTSTSYPALIKACVKDNILYYQSKNDLNAAATNSVFKSSVAVPEQFFLAGFGFCSISTSLTTAVSAVKTNMLNTFGYSTLPNPTFSYVSVLKDSVEIKKYVLNRKGVQSGIAVPVITSGSSIADGLQICIQASSSFSYELAALRADAKVARYIPEIPEVEIPEVNIPAIEDEITKVISSGTDEPDSNTEGMYYFRYSN